MQTTRIALTENEKYSISTIGNVTDSDHPYETAIRCDNFNQGKWVVVQEYDTETDAKNGHEKWIEFMESNPNVLVDVSTAEIKQLYSKVNEFFEKGTKNV